MSVMRYTFSSAVLRAEMTLLLTLPEATQSERLPFAAAVLLPQAGRESDCFLRREPLERYGGASVATVSLPGQFLLWQPEAFAQFLTDELPTVLAQFPLQVRALYCEGSTAAIMPTHGQALCEAYQTVRCACTVEALIESLKPTEETA